MSLTEDLKADGTKGESRDKIGRLQDSGLMFHNDLPALALPCKGSTILTLPHCGPHLNFVRATHVQSIVSHTF